jgi:hypothetical protein
MGVKVLTVMILGDQSGSRLLVAFDVQMKEANRRP